MTRSSAEQAVRMARALAAEEVPWFAPALFATRLVMSDACPALAAVDESMRVYFNPALVVKVLQSVPLDNALAQLALSGSKS